MSNRLSVNYADVSVTLRSNSVDIRPENAPFPLITGYGENIRSIGHASVIHTNSTEIATHVDDEALYLEAPAHKVSSARLLFYLGEIAAERIRQEHGGALIHSAAVSFPEYGKGLLILGEKGSGKTSTTIRACLDLSAELIANDQSIVTTYGGPKILTGSKGITIRRTAAEQDPVIGRLVSFDDTDQPNWDNKKILDPIGAGITPSLGNVALTDIIKVTIDRTLQRPYVEQRANDLHSMLFLAERTSRHIRGIASPLLSDTDELLGFSPNLDNPTTTKRRTELIQMFVENIGLTKIYAPNVDAVLDAINSQILR